MNTSFKPLSWALLWSLGAGIAVAQEPPASPPTAPSATVPAAPPATPSAGAAANSPRAPAKSTAQIDAGEPRANASPAAQSEAGEPRANASSAAPTPPATSSPARSPEQAANAGRTPTATGPKSAGAADRLQLGTATVTGDREQPKVMYIVPWKKSDIGDLSGKPMNSLLDEALAPVDRDEFKREVAYFDAVNSDTPQNGAPKPDPKQGEK